MVEYRSVTSDLGVTVHFAVPSEPLRPYLTAYYLAELGGTEEPVEDYLHPEWGNVRFSDGPIIEGSHFGEPLAPISSMVATGPTSRAPHFRIRPGRYWGVGMMPLGWARFVRTPAQAMADRYADALTDPAFELFRALATTVFDGAPNRAAESARIDQHMRQLLEFPAVDDPRITAINTALIDPDVATVTDLAAKTGLSVRALERVVPSAFGFSPQLLLRRQRFLRSLAHYMMDPTMRWIETLDSLYFDQAHFIRDFRRFMGMTPSAYAKLPHPVLAAATHARAAAAGQPMQVLNPPSRTP